MTAKTENYTDEMTVEMVNTYTAATDEASRDEAVEKLAEKFGKGVRSIRAKLSREGVYIAKVAKNKAGGQAMRKEKIVEGIVTATGLNPAKLSGLDKAPKLALQTILEFVTPDEMDDEIETD